jgi:hypothetical protein
MTLSVVIVIASDTVRRPGHAGHLETCLRALHAQSAVRLDVVVPHLPGVAGLGQLARAFPDVRFIEVTQVADVVPGTPYRDHHDALRTWGIAATSGEIVALLEDHEVPAPGWAAEVMTAHAVSGDAVIGGAVDNAIPRPLNWALCLCDFSAYLPPIAGGPSPVATDVNVSYKREALEVVAPVWRERFHERRVHEALRAAGHRIALRPAILVYQRRTDVGAVEAMIERMTWGRSYAATRADAWSAGRRVCYAAMTPVLPALLVTRIVRNVTVKHRWSAGVLAALPWVCALSAMWSLGELNGYLKPTGARGIPAAAAAQARTS